MRPFLMLLATLTLSFGLQGADPFVGTWKLNVEKSKLRPNSDVASETMTITETGPNTYRNTIDIVSKTGERRRQIINRTSDGKEHPATGEGFKQEGATEVNVRANSSTRKITQKRNGVVTSEITATLSADGKVMTNHRTGSSGEELDVLVFDKQ